MLAKIFLTLLLLLISLLQPGWHDVVIGFHCMPKIWFVFVLSIILLFIYGEQGARSIRVVPWYTKLSCFINLEKMTEFAFVLRRWPWKHLSSSAKFANRVITIVAFSSPKLMEETGSWDRSKGL